MGQMIRYFKLYVLSFNFSLMSAMVYRSNFILMLIQNMINILVTVFSIEYIFRYIVRLGEWSREEVIMVVCTSQIINAIYRGLIRPNLGTFSGSICQGTFDFVLLKPRNLFFMITLGKVDFSSLFSVLVPIYFIYLQICKMNITVSLLNIAVFVVFLIIGICTVTALMMIIFSMSFIFVNISKLEELYYTFMSIVEKPMNIFNKYLGFSFFFIIPLIPIANTPVVALLGKSSIIFLVKSILISVVFIAIATFTVLTGIKRYESASS